MKPLLSLLLPADMSSCESYVSIYSEWSRARVELRPRGAESEDPVRIGAITSKCEETSKIPSTSQRESGYH